MTKTQNQQIRGFWQTFIDAWRLYQPNLWLMTKLFLLFLGTVMAPLVLLFLAMDKKTSPDVAIGTLMVILIPIAIYWAIKIFSAISIWVCLVGQKEKSPALKELLTLGKSKMWPIFAVTATSGLLIFLGYMFFIVPGLIMMTMLAVVTPALIIEKRRIFESLDRSWQLVKGYGWEMLCFVLGINLLLNFVNFFITLLDKTIIVNNGIIDSLGAVNGLIVIFLTPLTMLMTVLRFLDLRQIKEIKEEKIAPVISKIKLIIITLILIILSVSIQAWATIGPFFTVWQR